MSDNPTSRPFECEKCGKTHTRCLGHRRRDGEPCGQQPLDGSDVCRTHGGKAPQAIAKAKERIAEGELRRSANRLGIPRVVDPGVGLIELVWEAAGNVEFYRSLVQDLPVHPEDDSLEQDEEGIYRWKRGKPGIYGLTYHQSGVPTGEAKRVILLQMYDDERDRLKSYIAEALRNNLEERRVRLAESDARELFAAVGAAASAAQLTPEQAETFRRELANNLRHSQPARLAS